MRIKGAPKPSSFRRVDFSLRESNTIPGVWAFSHPWYNSRMTHIERYAVALGERGRLVLPAQLRRRLDLHPGDRLILTVEPGGDVRVVTARAQARRLLGFYRDLASGRSLAHELIAGRQEEARREDAG